jgi:hypothetical protein
MVEIEQAGIEVRPRQHFYDGFDRQKFFGPDESLFRRAGIGVGIIGFAIPRDFSRGDDVFAENDCLVVLPSDAVQQRLVIPPRIIVAKDSPVIIHRAVARQQIRGRIVAKQVHSSSVVRVRFKSGAPW